MGLDLFDELFTVTTALDRVNISYALVGGLAYSVWVELRNTEDIDLLIRAEDWERIPPVLKPLGYQQLAMPMDFENVKIRRLTKFVGSECLVIDFLFANSETAKGIDAAISLEHRGRTFKIAPPDVIITLKEGRMSDQDQMDIKGLRRIMGERKP